MSSWYQTEDRTIITTMTIPMQDLNSIRSTLHLDRSEEEATDCFRKDFDESLKNAWTISVDWWFHSIQQLRTKAEK